MTSPETYSLFQLSTTKNVGPATIRRALRWSHSSGLRINQTLSDRKALEAAVGLKNADEVERSGEATPALIEAITAAGAGVIGLTDPDYPQRLSDVLGDKAPPIITVKGNREILNLPSIGFCGSRKASDRGIAAARDCASALARHGVNIVSGYAKGVDSEAHGNALALGSSTSIVLAEGITNFRIKKEFKSVWDWDRSVVISEFHPNAPWRAGAAMQRNATICGLSRAMVLVEARKSGGSYAAGMTALELGIPLYAADFAGERDESEGNRDLVSKGAQKLTRDRKTEEPLLEDLLATFRGQPVLAALRNERQLDLFADHTIRGRSSF